MIEVECQCAPSFTENILLKTKKNNVRSGKLNSKLSGLVALHITTRSLIAHPLVTKSEMSGQSKNILGVTLQKYCKIQMIEL